MRGEQEVELFSQSILAALNKPANFKKEHWLCMPRWRIWLKIFEESLEILTAYLWLCFAEVRHERFNTYQTLVDLIEARQGLGEEISDCAAVLMFLADSTAVLYCAEKRGQIT